jgi:uncharacterized protein YjbI with pentapeptide repeats/beta-lactamase regulating signal transducer with metallopeptidase domain
MELQQGFITVASAVSAIVVNALWQDALLVLCVWLLLRVWPKINAATRYVVWSATLFAALVVPIATTLPFFTPSRTVAVARQSALREIPPAVSSAPTLHDEPRKAAVRSAPAVTAPQESRLPARSRLTIPVPVALGVFALWLVLATLAIVRLTIGLLRLEQLKRDALPLPVEYRDAMPQWLRANKGARDVRLCVSDETDVPVAVGLFDAMILIPHSLLERLSEPEVDQICLHELAHLRRADDWTNGLQRVIAALLGWNPAAQFVGQQLDLEREVACDDWVLSFIGKVRPYALCLTKMAETALWPRHPIPAPGVFATRKHISLRIERLLGAGRNIATNLAVAPAAAAVGIVGALALVIAVVAPSVAAPVLSAPQVAAATAKTATTTAPETAATLAPAAAKTAEQKTPERIVTRYVRVAEVASPPPAPQPNATSVHVEVPGTHLKVPATHLNLPATHVNVPAIHVDVPGATVNVPGMSFDVGVPDAKALSQQIQAKIKTEMARGYGAKLAQGNSCVGCDYRGVSWPGRDLHGSNYNGVDFSKSNLSGVNFSASSMNGADFTDANLSGASFRHAHLTGCDFTNANLTGADFTGAWMSGCQFTRARLGSSQLRDVLNGCKGCDFSKADLSGLDLGGVRVNGDDFSEADLRNVNFSGAELVGSDFSRAKLDGANFNGATLNGCDLSGVDLSRVDLSRAKLIGTDLERP